jgi:hypothetical protein
MEGDDRIRRPSEEEARSNMIQMLRARPALVGELAIAIGPSWSLDETERLLDELVTEGVLTREDTPLIRYSLAPGCTSPETGKTV